MQRMSRKFINLPHQKNRPYHGQIGLGNMVKQKRGPEKDRTATEQSAQRKVALVPSTILKNHELTNYN